MHFCNPMRKDCRANFSALEDLDYCQNRADSASDEVTCSYMDAWELPIHLPEGVLMPTRTSTYEQRRSCEPELGAENQCLGMYHFQEGVGENMTLQIGDDLADTSSNF